METEIRRILKEKKLTLTNLAGKISINRITLQNGLENNTLKIRDFLNIAIVFEMSPCELFSKVINCDDYVIKTKRDDSRDDIKAIIGELNIENYKLKQKVARLETKIENHYNKSFINN